MNQNSLAHAGYWRNSLVDAGSGRGGLKIKDAQDFLPLQTPEIATGRVSDTITKKCFFREAERVQTVEVLIRPKVYCPRIEHGARRRSGRPDIVTPIITRALLARNGRLYPLPNTVIPRDILEPLDRGSFVIGTVFDQDAFLTTNTVPDIVYHEQAQPDESEFEQRWSSYLAGCERLLEQVGQGWPTVEDGFEMANYGYLVKKASVHGASQHIVALYDHIRDNTPSAPLFDRYASTDLSPTEPCLPTGAAFSARLGHCSDEFPLRPEQRVALAHLLATNKGDILAVNGPPGTGKTTLLLSIVATLWARAAVEGGEPPVVLAASTNNQAVTNIIDAFRKDFSTGTGPFAGRWLPKIKSFGGYFPAKDKEAELEDEYQTRSFFEMVESAGYVLTAQKEYLQAAAHGFPENASEGTTVQTIVIALQQAIKKEVEKLHTIESAWSALTAAREAVRAELGEDPAVSLADRRQQLARTEGEKLAFGNLVERWDAYLAHESLLYSLFSWLPPVARKRLRLARLFLKDTWPPQQSYNEWQNIEQIEATINATLGQLNHALQQQKVCLQRGEDALQLEQERVAGWRSALAVLEIATGTEHLSLAECDTIADTHIRFTIFLLTTHYWEGRWLIDMEAALPRIDEEKRWRRRMKLTPCIVSTLFMLPSLMKFSRHKGHDFTDYLYDFADLLIVDEAGQVLPEVAGASFALSKRALVIGDTLQIEPIWSIPVRVDIGNLRSAGLLPDRNCNDAYHQLSESGMTAASGSVMRIAQRVTRYHYDRDLARGLFLYEHRRCFNEIIDYCNKLCYHGKLIPKRGAKADAHQDPDGFPAIGYLHIDGICQQSSGGSRQNLLEADSIAAWLNAHRKELETKYNKHLCEIVGVISPFASQVSAITQSCHNLGIRVGNKKGEMTVGTVHSLQGAERLVVIFSSVYSKHADGGFIDRSPSMLNVSVSRAKNTFLVFGDMDVFEVVSKETPRGQLAALLFQDPANALHFESRPRRDLKSSQADIRQLRDAQEHDTFLLDTLANVAREIHIVTPWILLERIEEIGAREAMSAAIERGIRVSVYTDPEFNTNDNDPQKVALKREKLLADVEFLRKKGIETIFVGRVHSKAVIGDDNLYCVGSFNWFSASRDSRYTRHETSLVYRGFGLTSEIGIMLKSLKERVTHCRQ